VENENEVEQQSHLQIGDSSTVWVNRQPETINSCTHQLYVLGEAKFPDCPAQVLSAQNQH